MVNNVDIDQNTSNENEMKDQHESKITNDDNDVNPSLNDTEQIGNSSEILNESNEVMSYPTSKGQIIRQHKFCIHSTWLAVQSSYFRSLFFSGMKETNTTEVHVQISESEEQAHLMLLEAMYKIDILDNADVDELLKVLTLAHKYDVKFVFKKCKYCLQAIVDSLEICEKIMCFIKVDNTITDVEDLASTLQSFLAKEFSPLDKTWQTTSFKELCEPSLKYLLSSDELVAESENTIFHALIHWMEECGIENVLNSLELPSLLSVIRFELIPIDYLYNIVQHNPVAKKLSDFNDHYVRGISYHALSDNMKEKLPSQPVKRKPIDAELFLAYTWMIPRDKLKNLVGTGQRHVSDVFWYCGYRILLLITNVVKVQHYEAKFTAKLGLVILNLTQQSEVTIQWQPSSQSFTSYVSQGSYTFEKKTCTSFVDIEYKMELQQEKSGRHKAKVRGHGSTGTFSFGCQPAIPATTGFSFGAAPSGPALGVSIKPVSSKPVSIKPVSSKPVSILKQESPMPRLSIDVNMKLR